MGKSEMKGTVRRFCGEYGLSEPTADNLKRILQAQGYTVIEFNNVFNDPEVDTLVKSLGLGQMIGHSKGFTYADRHRRLVFVHEELSEREQLIVLAHEEGHIRCGHTTSAPIIGRDVLEEYEANEFAHYLLNPGKTDRLVGFVSRYKLRTAAVLLAAALAVGGIAAGAALGGKQAGVGEYYITVSGHKYHKKDCVYVKDKSNIHQMTEKEFKSGEYEPCSVCLPEAQR